MRRVWLGEREQSELAGNTQCRSPAASACSHGHTQIVVWLRNGTSIRPARSVAHKEEEVVVICEEKRGFCHQVKICPKEAFDADQRECEAFRFSLNHCSELFTTKTSLLCPPHSSTQRTRAFGSSDLRVISECLNAADRGG